MRAKWNLAWAPALRSALKFRWGLDLTGTIS